ncbi:MAG: hypothetical protein PUG10_09285 [Lachnospiraceae bacterium]|nr:hypothetical protein [Lachnospiraceae bacterium]
MLTQGTNERGSNTNKNRNVRTPKEGYAGRRPGSGYGSRPEGGRNESREDRPNKGGNNRFSRQGQANDSARFGKNDNNHYGKSDYDKNRGYNRGFSGKDEDEENNGRRSKPSRPKESKPGVAIPDKNKTMLRLEKEQKTMLKKQNKKKETSRPQPKQKRSNNVNYTKNYNNGAYDDYEDFYDYD